MMRWFWIVTVAALFYGCGGKERPNQVTTTNTGGHAGPVTTGGRASGGNGSGGDAGSGAGPDVTPGGAGGDGGAAAVDARAPIVEITSPAASSDPDKDEVLLTDNVTVLCAASKSKASGSVAVDPSKVEIEMLDASDKVLKAAGGMPTGKAGEYSATFAVSDLPNGVVSFRCTASDIAAAPRVGSAQISSFVDRGPTITITAPKVNQILALSVPVSFEFKVEPAPLADGDVGAKVREVTLTALGLPVSDLAPAPGRPGVYLASLDFGDPVLFPQAPSGDIPVVITATNSRSPTAAVQTEAYSFKLDGDGPVIKISSPVNNQILGPKDQLLTFTVTDVPSGVNRDSVSVTLNNGKPFPFEPPPSAWVERNGTFTFRFDSTKLVGSVAEATINIHAVDNVGNEADGESLIVKLDDYPPIVSLDPGLVRVMFGHPGSLPKPKCSSVFDPLGSAVSDKDTIPTAAMFRVLVWDETNHATGSIADYPSYVDPTTVSLYIQPDVEWPLLIDSDGDGRCDAINSKAADGASVLLTSLKSVKPGGSVPNTTPDLGDEPTAGDQCDLATGQSVFGCPDHSSDMRYVLKHEVPGAIEPVIYALNPVADAAIVCNGNTWEVGGRNKPGWVCMAAAASDKARNDGVSAPLRVCIDDNVVPDDTSPCEGIAPPTCTDGCTPPPEFASRVIHYPM